jgi:hypothetical protein
MSLQHRAVAGYTLVREQQFQHPLFVLDGLVVLPIGAEIELSDRCARVTHVSLMAGTPTEPSTVCLDVEVPEVPEAAISG